MVCKLPRKINITELIPVTITGTGDSNHCWLTYNGVDYTTAGTLHVSPGGVITFNVRGNSSSSYIGYVNIDGTQVAKTSASRLTSYDWTIPDNVTSISVSLVLYHDSTYIIGRITVTTT